MIRNNENGNKPNRMKVFDMLGCECYVKKYPLPALLMSQYSETENC